MNKDQLYHGIVIGASAGGWDALVKILFGLPENYALPILVVQHRHMNDFNGLERSLKRKIPLPVISPCDKQEIEPGKVYIAPANYHMLVERTGIIALSLDEKVKWSRPSIDVLFESAAHAWGKGVIALLLTGANSDGMEGMITVKALGGLTIAQDPTTAEAPVMPRSAIDAGAVRMVLTPAEIAGLLVTLKAGRHPGTE